MIPRLQSAETTLILKDLQHGPATINDLMGVTGRANNTVWRLVKDLEAAGKIKVIDYERTRGREAAVYGLRGKPYKVKKFIPLTDAERAKRKRERRGQ